LLRFFPYDLMGPLTETIPRQAVPHLHVMMRPLSVLAFPISAKLHLKGLPSLFLPTSLSFSAFALEGKLEGKPWNRIGLKLSPHSGITYQLLIDSPSGFVIAIYLLVTVGDISLYLFAVIHVTSSALLVEFLRPVGHW
jgi:hypothetical protein